MPGSDPRSFRPERPLEGQKPEVGRPSGRAASSSQTSTPVTPTPTVGTASAPAEGRMTPPATASPSANTPPFVAPKDRPSSPPESSRQERTTAERAKEKVAEGVAAANQEARSRVELGRSELAGHVGSAAYALKDMGKKLRDDQEDTVAQVTDRVGEGLQRFSDYLENRDTGELMEDAKTFARRNPAVFLGGAALLGFAAARFLRSKSSAPEEDDYGIAGGGPNIGGLRSGTSERRESTQPMGTPSQYGSSLTGTSQPRPQTTASSPSPQPGATGASQSWPKTTAETTRQGVAPPIPGQPAARGAGR